VIHYCYFLASWTCRQCFVDVVGMSCVDCIGLVGPEDVSSSSRQKKKKNKNEMIVVVGSSHTLRRVV
jgi:hypothetical protein